MYRSYSGDRIRATSYELRATKYTFAVALLQQSKESTANMFFPRVIPIHESIASARQTWNHLFLSLTSNNNNSLLHATTQQRQRQQPRQQQQQQKERSQQRSTMSMEGISRMVTPRKAHQLHHRSPRQGLKALATSSWREVLVESCLQKARERRSKAASRRRQEIMARTLVEEQLQHSGVAIVPLSQSPPRGHGDGIGADSVRTKSAIQRGLDWRDDTMQLPMQIDDANSNNGVSGMSASAALELEFNHVEHFTKGTEQEQRQERQRQQTRQEQPPWQPHNPGNPEYTISEEELYELMEEVEEELRREDELFAAERAEQLDSAELQHCIEEFQEWESGMQLEERFSHGEDDLDGLDAGTPEHTVSVICPICQDMELLQQQNAVVCPNTNCPLSLCRHGKRLTLSTLLRSLQETLTLHSDECTHNLEFAIRKDEGMESEQPRLVGRCLECGWQKSVLQP